MDLAAALAALAAIAASSPQWEDAGEALRVLRAAWRQTPVFRQQAEEHRRATEERRRHEAEMAARREAEAENVGGSV